MLAAQLATALLDSPLFDAARRPLLERHVAPTPVVWSGTARSQLAVEFWSFLLEQQQARPAQSTVFATPRLSERQARALCESASCAAGVALSPLESDAPVAGVRCEPSGWAVLSPERERSGWLFCICALGCDGHLRRRPYAGVSIEASYCTDLINFSGFFV